MQDLSISRRKFGVQILEQYFAKPVNQLTVDERYDLIVNYCTDQSSVHNRKVYTSLIDLQQTEEAIFNRFHRKCRRNIRSVAEQYSASMLALPTSEAIADFCAFYNAFASQKNLEQCNEQKLVLFAEQGKLTISQLSYPDDPAMLCAHAYIHNSQRGRLLYSVSRFREFGQDTQARNQLAKAHKYLHWQDITQFKHWGFSVYDLGGVAMNTSVELGNINHFKQGFGGVIEQEFVNAYPQSIRGWLAMKYLLRQL